MIFFTADNHFGHHNVIKYCNRPFRTIREMDNSMIEKWNYRVKSGDIVYHLGDFTLYGSKKCREYFSELNGQIYVLANWSHHDKNWINKDTVYNKTFFETPYQSKTGQVVRLIDPIFYINFMATNTHVVMCHFPMQEWNKKHYGSIHLHGHSHGNCVQIPNRYDVGVDCFDFYPVTLEEIIKKGQENDSIV